MPARKRPSSGELDDDARVVAVSTDPSGWELTGIATVSSRCGSETLLITAPHDEQNRELLDVSREQDGHLTMEATLETVPQTRVRLSRDLGARIAEGTGFLWSRLSMQYRSHTKSHLRTPSDCNASGYQAVTMADGLLHNVLE